MRLLVLPALALALATPRLVTAQVPTQVTFTGSPQSPISSNVAIPAGRASLWISGTVPQMADPKAPEGSRERWGDTKAQARTILKTFEAQLAAKGLSLRDVVYMRVYIAPDKAQGGKFDFQGWFDAYGEFFGTAQNPTKVSRSTIGVPTLVSPDWLIEIEAFAVFPADR
ncbi:MAG: hypothetical protein HY275_02185 [Gemmatimonadetes bacterium]|nr:hypothetical protein [Gemmatimonadota bacterium]